MLDANTGRAIAGSRVTLIDADAKARPDRDGRFRLSDLPAGRANVKVEAPGFATSVEQVTVYEGRSTVVRFELAPLAAILDELFVTGQPRALENRSVGESVGRLDSRELEMSVSSSATELLAGRIPGAFVMRSSGQVGAGSRILLRGVNSISLSNDPLIYVDGIRVSNATVRTAGTATLSLTVLDLVDPSSIERIEVLRGPAAGMQYGPGSSSGVILIYTKKGPPHPES